LGLKSEGRGFTFIGNPGCLRLLAQLGQQVVVAAVVCSQLFLLLAHTLLQAAVAVVRWEQRVSQDPTERKAHGTSG